MKPKLKTSVRTARPKDVLQILDVLETVYAEVDTELHYDEKHALKHVAGILCNGVSFVAEAEGKIVGVLMCGHIDVAFASTDHLESIHWYTVPEARSTGAAGQLLDAIEAFVSEQNIVVIFHQADYHSALSGRPNNSRAVERAYRKRGYEGPLDIATVGYEGRRVGVSYRYPSRTDP